MNEYYFTGESVIKRGFHYSDIKLVLKYVWNHMPCNCWLNSLFVLTSKFHLAGPFPRGIRQWLVDVLYTGPLLQKSFPYHDIIFFIQMITFFTTFNGPVIKCLCIFLSSHSHKDIIKWKLFPHYWPFVQGIHRSGWLFETSSCSLWLHCFAVDSCEIALWLQCHFLTCIFKSIARFYVSLVLHDFNLNHLIDATWYHRTSSTLFQVMAWYCQEASQCMN